MCVGKARAERILPVSGKAVDSGHTDTQTSVLAIMPHQIDGHFIHLVYYSLTHSSLTIEVQFVLIPEQISLSLTLSLFPFLSQVITHESRVWRQRLLRLIKGKKKDE